MPTTSHWPQDTMRELFARAETDGESKAEVSSRGDAIRFRFALYTFRRRVGGFSSISISVENTNVLLKKIVEPSVSIVQEG